MCTLIYSRLCFRFCIHKEPNFIVSTVVVELVDHLHLLLTLGSYVRTMICLREVARSRRHLINIYSILVGSVREDFVFLGNRFIG